MKKGIPLLTVLLGMVFLTPIFANGDMEQNANGDGIQEVNVVFVQLSASLPDLSIVEAAINERTESEINAHINLVGLPISNYSQQIRLMLASREKMDLFLTGTLPFFDFPGQLANKQLLPLNEPLNAYGQELQDTVGDFLNVSKAGGNIYAVPTFRDEAKAPGYGIRADLVEKYNIDLSQIRSIEDIEPILALIRENEPDLIPFNPCQEMSTGLDVSIHIPGGDPLSSDHYFTGVLMDADNGNTKLVNYYETPQAKNLFEMTRRWYQAGYIGKSFLTGTESGTQLVQAGRLASLIQDVKPGVESQLSNQCGMPMRVVPLAEPISYTGVVGAFMWAVPNYTDVPEAAVRFLNMMYSDEDIINKLIWGIEGRHYVITDDGTIDYPEGIDANTSGYPMFSSFLWGNSLKSHIFKGDSITLWDDTQEFNDTAVKSVGLGFIFDPTPVKTEYAACTNVWQQYEKVLGIGAADPDELLEEFISNLKDAGVDAIITEKQRQFDAWLKLNN